MLNDKDLDRRRKIEMAERQSPMVGGGLNPLDFGRRPSPDPVPKPPAMGGPWGAAMSVIAPRFGRAAAPVVEAVVNKAGAIKNAATTAADIVAPPSGTAARALSARDPEASKRFADLHKPGSPTPAPNVVPQQASQADATIQLRERAMTLRTQRAQMQRELLRRYGGSLYGKELSEADRAVLADVRSMGDELGALEASMRRPGVPRKPDGSVDTDALRRRVIAGHTQLQNQAAQYAPDSELAKAPMLAVATGAGPGALLGGAPGFLAQRVAAEQAADKAVSRAPIADAEAARYGAAHLAVADDLSKRRAEGLEIRQAREKMARDLEAAQGQAAMAALGRTVRDANADQSPAASLPNKAAEIEATRLDSELENAKRLRGAQVSGLETPESQEEFLTMAKDAAMKLSRTSQSKGAGLGMVKDAIGEREREVEGGMAAYETTIFPKLDQVAAHSPDMAAGIARTLLSSLPSDPAAELSVWERLQEAYGRVTPVAGGSPHNFFDPATYTGLAGGTGDPKVARVNAKAKAGYDRIRARLMTYAGAGASARSQ